MGEHRGLCWRESTHSGKIPEDLVVIRPADGLLQSDCPRVCGTPAWSQRTGESAEAASLHLLELCIFELLSSVFIIIQ